MINYYKNALIIAPHSMMRSLHYHLFILRKNNISKIDILLIQYDERRLKEAYNSSKFHRFNLKRFPENIDIKESFFSFEF